MELKNRIITHLTALLQERIKIYQAEWLTLQQELGQSTKSSAGDKYETSVEMEQQSRNQLEKQLVQNKRHLTELELLKTELNATSCKKGTLVHCSNQLLFISIPFGKFIFEEKEILILGPTSPLAQVFLGKKEKETVVFAGKSYYIDKIE